MIEIYVRDINTSLENKAYFSALAMALALPDICGNVEYPDEPSVAKRYINWYDAFIGNYDFINDVSYLSGEIVYNLRNTFLHTGSPNINKSKIKTEVNQLDKFNLVLGDGKKFWSVTTNIDTPDVSLRVMTINVTYLCQKICDCALWYYNNNRDKFHFDFHIFMEDDMLDPLTEEKLNSDPILQALNQKLNSSGSKYNLKAEANENLTKEIMQVQEKAIHALFDSPIDSNQGQDVKSSGAEKKHSKREAQVRSFFGQHFKENKYSSKKEAIVQAVLKSKNKQQVNNVLMKTFSSDDTGVIYKRLKPLIKDMPGK